jgi:hypothetical protein
VRSTSQRGVCVVAAVPAGGLQAVLGSPELSPLLGGVTAVPVWDEAAQQASGAHKSRRERTGASTFAAAVEVLAVNRWAGAFSLLRCDSNSSPAG